MVRADVMTPPSAPLLDITFTFGCMAHSRVRQLHRMSLADDDFQKTILTLNITYFFSKSLMSFYHISILFYHTKFAMLIASNWSFNDWHL